VQANPLKRAARVAASTIMAVHLSSCKIARKNSEHTFLLLVARIVLSFKRLVFFWLPVCRLLSRARLHTSCSTCCRSAHYSCSLAHCHGGRWWRHRPIIHSVCSELERKDEERPVEAGALSLVQSVWLSEAAHADQDQEAAGSGVDLLL